MLRSGADAAALHAEVTAATTAAPAAYNWDFTGSVYFAFTVCTTIGYGNFSPVTPLGRLFCTVYAIVSIPLMLTALARICDVVLTAIARQTTGRDKDLIKRVFRMVDVHGAGELDERETLRALRMIGLGFTGTAQDKQMRRRLKRFRKTFAKADTHGRGVLRIKEFKKLLRMLVPDGDESMALRDVLARGNVALASVGVVVLFLLAMCLTFALLEREAGWSALDAGYFAIITLLTVGLGDLAPLTAGAAHHPWWVVVIWCVFATLGLGFTSAMVTALFDPSLSIAGTLRATLPARTVERSWSRLSQSLSRSTLRSTGRSTVRSTDERSMREGCEAEDEAEDEEEVEPAPAPSKAADKAADDEDEGEDEEAVPAEETAGPAAAAAGAVPEQQGAVDDEPDELPSSQVMGRSKLRRRAQIAALTKQVAALERQLAARTRERDEARQRATRQGPVATAPAGAPGSSAAAPPQAGDDAGASREARSLLDKLEC